MDEMNTNMNNQEMNQDTTPAAADMNGLAGLAVKGLVGVASLITAYKLGKRAKAEEKETKPKKKLHFQSPIVLVEKEQPEEEEKTEEKEVKDQKETKKK